MFLIRVVVFILCLFNVFVNLFGFILERKEEIELVNVVRIFWFDFWDVILIYVFFKYCFFFLYMVMDFIILVLILFFKFFLNWFILILNLFKKIKLFFSFDVVLGWKRRSIVVSWVLIDVMFL